MIVFFLSEDEQLRKTIDEYMEKGYFYWEKEDYYNAAIEFCKAFQLAPISIMISTRYMGALEKIKESDNAENLFKSIIELHPDNAYAYIQLGELYYENAIVEEVGDGSEKQVKDYELLRSAAKILTEAIKLLSGNSDWLSMVDKNSTMISLASVYADLEQYDKACALYEEALNRDHPAYARFYIDLAQIYEKTNTESAIECYEKYLEVASDEYDLFYEEKIQKAKDSINRLKK